MPNGEKTARTHKYRIRLSEEEFEMVQRLKAAGINITDILRKALDTDPMDVEKRTNRRGKDGNRMREYCFRLDDVEWEKLQRLKSANMNVADILWNALENTHNENCAPKPKLTHMQRLAHFNLAFFEQLVQSYQKESV